MLGRKISSGKVAAGVEICKSEEEQKAKVNELRLALGPLSGRAQVYADDACLKRYLRARSWNVKHAEKMLRDSLAWREAFKPEEIRWADVAVEFETGKGYRETFRDKVGHSVVMVHPARQNSNSQVGQIKMLVYLLENAILNLPEGQEQTLWLLNFQSFGYKHLIPMSLAREAINILQNHYPERLHVYILYDPPRVFETFYNILKPFLDPNTCRKVKFVYSKDAESMKILTELFDEGVLNGTINSPNDYNQEEYSKLMQEDDLRSTLFWQGACGIKAEAKRYSDTPDAVAMNVDLETPKATPVAAS